MAQRTVTRRNERPATLWGWGSTRVGQAPVRMSVILKVELALSFSETLGWMPILSPVPEATLPPDPALLTVPVLLPLAL